MAGKVKEVWRHACDIYLIRYASEWGRKMTAKFPLSAGESNADRLCDIKSDIYVCMMDEGRGEEVVELHGGQDRFASFQYGNVIIVIETESPSTSPHKSLPSRTFIVFIYWPVGGGGGRGSVRFP